MMALLSLKGCLNMVFILSSETIPSVISQNSPIPLGMFTTLSKSLLLESQYFLSNRSMVAMNFWLFILNHSWIRIAPAFMCYSATLLMLYTIFLHTPEFKLRLFYSLLCFLFIVIFHLHFFDFLMIPIFLLPHSPYSTHSNSNLCIFVTCCHHFTYGDNATITPHVLLLLFAIFLISIFLPLCYLTTLLLAYTSPSSLAMDLCALLVFKQPVHTCS